MSNCFFTSAKICLNGDICSSNSECYTESSILFCEKCGEEVISECPSCHAPIHGEYGYFAENYLFKNQYFEVVRKLQNAPAYCHNCGEAYPWTKTRLQAAENIINMLDELTIEQKKQLIEFIPDITTETPRSQYAALMYAKLLDGLQGLTIECFKIWAKENVLPALLVLMNMQK